MIRLLNFILDFFYPKNCLGCGLSKTYLCPQCLENIPQLEHQICFICQRPAISGLTHPKCLKRNSLDGLVVASHYQGVLKKVIKVYKYQFVSELANPLTKLLEKVLGTNPLKADFITYVPLSKDKESIRGFNQAKLLAHNLATFLNIELKDSLKKTRKTASQAELSVGERLTNNQNAFKSWENLKGKKIILVDDVCTTGSTFNECCKALKKSGASKVYGLVLARGK